MYKMIVHVSSTLDLARKYYFADTEVRTLNHHFRLQCIHCLPYKDLHLSDQSLCLYWSQYSVGASTDHENNSRSHRQNNPEAFYPVK